MRLVVGLLSLVLSSSLALAGETPATAEASAPAATVHRSSGLRVVKLLPESHQALLFDKTLDKHVLVEPGQQVGAYTVEEIAADEVTLFDQAGGELVLAAPLRSHSRGVKARAATDAPAPSDPYAESEIRSASTVPITAGEGGIRVVDAGGPPASTKPAASMGSEIDDVGFELPVAVAPAPNAKAAPANPYGDDASTPNVPAFVVAAATAGPGEAGERDEPNVAAVPPMTPTVISRTELDLVLADFGRLSTMMRGRFTPQGVRLDAVSEASIFAKAGLRPGDVIVAVDSTQLRTLDDAAELYARAAATKAANISLLRAGQPLTLRVLIH